MIDFDAEAKLNQIGARFTVSNLERDRAVNLIDRMMMDRIRAQLAAHLSKEAVRVTENVYSTDYEVRLYVLTPDQLEKYVQRRAMQFGYMPTSITEQTFEPVKK